MHVVMVGGSDADIRAALRTRELDPSADVTVVVADSYPNALGGGRQFAGSLGTQVVKIFDQAAARTGLRDPEATAAGYDQIAKRIDIAATAIFHGMTVEDMSDLDVSYTPPLGSPWEAVQMGAQAWARQVRLPRT
jgi:NADPH-dependent 2,4-dienoyl-CoA reductase/sulfur reductase-like enzyme